MPTSISATKLDNFFLCHRKAYFSTRLRRKPNPAFSFGTALHSVAERYLSADDNGRVPPPPEGTLWASGPLSGQSTGETVDLYPLAWDEGLQPGEAALIKRLVHKGIQEGVLERRPGRVVEGRFERPLDDDSILVGVIDLLLPGEIQDHKTTKDMRWAVGKEQLLTNIQMLVYAWEYFCRHPEEDEVVLRHNTFCKQGTVRYRDNTVDRASVESWWDKKVKPAIKQIIADEQTEDWTAVEEAPRGSGACEKYGGCPFTLICTGFESPEQYNQRIDRAMGVFDDIQQTTKTTKAAPPSMPSSKPKPPEPEPDNEAPPWANPECSACEGAGFNTKGNPCRICDSEAEEDNKSSNYTVASDDEGNVSWERKAKPKPKATKPKTKPLPPVAVEEDDDTSQGKQRGRPKLGFTLCIGCTPERAPGGTIVYADKLLYEVGQALAKKLGVDSFYEIPFFDRRDAVAAQMETICKGLTGRSYVIANGDDQDTRAFVGAMRPFAQTVVQGNAG